MRKGYTLVEILVSIAIFMILTGAMIASFRGVTVKDRIRASSLEILSLLRQARNASFNGIVDKTTGQYPAGGYGLYLDKDTNRMVMFADNDNNAFFDENEAVQSSPALSSDVRLVLARDNNIHQMAVMFQKDGRMTLHNNKPACRPDPSCVPSEEVTCVLCFPITSSQGVMLTVRDARTSNADPCTVTVSVSRNQSTDKSLYISSNASQC